MLNLLQVDSKNRALRTFIVGIASDVAVAVVLVLVTVFGGVNGWGDVQWAALGFTLAKTVIMTAGSYILRRFVDRSSIPTPLPPAPVPPPADVTPEV